MKSERISVEEANRLDRDEFVARLGPLFEGSSHFAETAWQKRPFRGFPDLFGAFRKAVSADFREFSFSASR